MKIQAYRLEGIALDYATARAVHGENIMIDSSGGYGVHRILHNGKVVNPSVSLLIQRFKISVMPSSIAWAWCASAPGGDIAYADTLDEAVKLAVVYKHAKSCGAYINVPAAMANAKKRYRS